MKRRHLFLAVSLAGAAWLVLSADRKPANAVAEPVTRAVSTDPTTAKKRAERSKATAEPKIALVQPRAILIGGAGLEQNADALFLSHSWAPPPAPPPKPQAPPAPPPPSAPAMPFTYLGKKLEDGKWEVYLARGDQSYIVGEQTAVDSLYRTGAIKPPLLTIIYLPLNTAQTLDIGESE